jgi:hypothetical protein
MKFGANIFNIFIDGLACRCPEERAATTSDDDKRAKLITSFPATPALMQFGARCFNTFTDGLACQCREERAGTMSVRSAM